MSVDPRPPFVDPRSAQLFTLGEILDYEQPTKYLVSSSTYSDAFDTPVVTAGRTFILGYTEETSGIYPASRDNPVIIFDDFTTSRQWVDFPFKAKSSAMKILTLKRGVKADLRFIYFAMTAIGFKPKGHARHWIETYSKLQIPLPSLEDQRARVALIDELHDTQSALDDALAEELTLRRRQSDIWVRELLSVADDSVTWSTLPNVAKNLDFRRAPVTKSERIPGEIPYYGASGVVDHVQDFIFDGDYLLVSEDGANLLARTTPIAFSISGQTWVNNHAHVLEFRSATMRQFVEIYLNSIDLSPYITGGAQAKLSQANLNKIPIPVLPRDRREQIVESLSQLKSSLEVLIAGIKAERGARARQLEYYRHRLLTFEELPA